MDHNDTMIKDERSLLSENMYLSLYCKVLWWEGAGDQTKTAIYWPPLLWPSALCLSRSPGLLSRRPRGPALCWMMAFFTASYQQLLWTPTHQGLQGPPPSGFLYHILSATSLDSDSIGGPEGPFGLVWLSLPHLVSNSNCLTFCLDRVI